MKAVFVIDVDKDELGEAVATITANDITFFARGVIRPLPEMKEENVMYLTNKYDVDYYEDSCAVAYNDCLREILGETE